MIYSGPYNTPPVLARMPVMALFWTIAAPFIFQIATFGFASALMPNEFAALFESEDRASMQTLWLVFVISEMFLFMALSLWAERIDAGPFAGSMRADPYWLILAIGLGPIILIGAGSVAGMLFSNGDPNWLYRDEEVPTYLGANGFGLMMVLFTVVLAPLVEEVAFRGVALGSLLARGWQPLHAALLVSAIFAGLHLQYSFFALPPVFLIGMFLAWLRIRSGSVAAPILAHMSANGVTMLLYWLSIVSSQT